MRAPSIVHGESSPAELADHPLFAGISSPTEVARYHSLCVDEATLPTEWSIIAKADVPMAMVHHQLPRWGVQFHPESILTPQGAKMMQNFLEHA